MTLCGLRPHVLVLGPLLAAACSSAPSESPADQPVPPAAAPARGDLIRDFHLYHAPPATNFCTRLPVDASPT